MKFIKNLIIKDLGIILMLLNLGLFLYYNNSFRYIVYSKLFMFVPMIALMSYKAYCLLKMKKNMFYQLRDNETDFEHYLSVIKPIYKDSILFVVMSMIFSLKIITICPGTVFYYFFDIVFLMAVFSFSIMLLSKNVSELGIILNTVFTFGYVLLGYSCTDTSWYSGFDGSISTVTMTYDHIWIFILIIVMIIVVNIVKIRKLKKKA